MKINTILILIVTCLLIDTVLFAQDDNTASIASTDAAENLDLSAVLAIFQESKDLEDFERKLNEKDGVNNLDLNDDGEVDYIRVNELKDGYYRVIVLQAVLGENDVQDVAVINVERKSENDVKVECEGNKEIYGENYYVAPQPTVQVNVWPIWRVIFAPHYVVYHSPWHYHRYPPYWYGRPPVPPHVYHKRHVVVVHRHSYVYRPSPHVHRPPHVYHPHRSSNKVVRTNNHPSNRARTNTNINRANTHNRTTNSNVKTNPNNRKVNPNVKTNPNNRKTNPNVRTNPNNKRTTPNKNYNRQTTPNRNYNRASTPSRSNYNRSTRPTTRYRTGGGVRRR